MAHERSLREGVQESTLIEPVSAGVAGPIPAVWAQAQPAGGGWDFLILLFLMFAVFYFVLILPAQRQRKKHQAMLDALKAGDKVVTQGGLLGTVVGLRDKAVTLRVGDNLRVEVMRGYIAGHQPASEETTKE